MRKKLLTYLIHLNNSVLDHGLQLLHIKLMKLVFLVFHMEGYYFYLINNGIITPDKKEDEQFDYHLH